MDWLWRRKHVIFLWRETPKTFPKRNIRLMSWVGESLQVYDHLLLELPLEILKQLHQYLRMLCTELKPSCCCKMEWPSVIAATIELKISPAKTISAASFVTSLVWGSSTKCFKRSTKYVPLEGSPPTPTHVDCFHAQLFHHSQGLKRHRLYS